jgi:flagellar biosynthetic protein FliR
MLDSKIILMAHLPVFCLVLARVAGLFVFAPVWGSTVTAWKLKAMIALVIGACLYPVVMLNVLGAGSGASGTAGASISLWVLPILIFMEVMVGLAIGYGASLPVLAFKQAGALMDTQMGVGFSSDSDASSEFGGGPLARLCMFGAVAVFVLMGGHRVLFLILASSFEHIPLGGFRVDGQLIPLLTGLLTAMFSLALRIAAPLLCLVFVQMLVLGMMARTAPAFNVFSVGLPLRVLLVIGGLILAFGAMTGVFVDAVQLALDQISHAFGPGFK